MKTIDSQSIFACVLSLGILLFGVPAVASGTHNGMMGETGRAGDPEKITRTIEIVMHDNFYEPEEISVKEGETVRFVIKNAGEFVHEFNIGTAAMHASHGSEMAMMMDHGVIKGGMIDWEAAKAMQASMGHGMHEEPNS